MVPALDPVVHVAHDDGLSLREIIDLLLRGKWILLAGALALLVPTLIYGALQPSLYRSTATLLIQKNQSSLQGVLPDAASFYQTGDDLANEILLLRESMPLAEGAAERLLQIRRAPGSDAPLTILEPLGDGSAPTVQDVAFRLQDHYIASAPDEAGATAVRVSATSTDPAEAELVANVYADAFVELTLQQSRTGITRSREFLGERLQDQGEELRRRDADVQGFLEREGAVALDTETEQTVRAIGELQGQVGALDVEAQTAQARLATLQAELRRLEPLLSQRLGSGLDSDLETAQERVQEIEAQLEAIYVRTPEYRSAPSSADPELGRLRGQLEQARARVRAVADQLSRQSIASGSGPGEQGAGFARVAELRTQITEAEVALSEARARRAQVARQLAQAEADLGEVPSQSIELAQLQRDREAAEALYGALQANYQEAQVAEQSQIGIGRVIRPAFLSEAPSLPTEPATRS